MVQPSPDFSGHFNMDFNFDFNNIDAFPITPALSEDRRSSSTSDSGMLFEGNSTFGSALSPNDFAFDTNYGGFSYEFQDFATNPNVGMNTGNFQVHNHGHPSGGVSLTSHEQQVSPGAQDPTFTPDLYDGMNIDEGYGAVASAPGEDFTLFGSRQPTTSAGEMFPALAEGSGSWGNFGGQFDGSSKQPAVRMPTESSVLHDLFPELNNNH
jgi:hypothetical protein